MPLDGGEEMIGRGNDPDPFEAPKELSPEAQEQVRTIKLALEQEFAENQSSGMQTARATLTDLEDLKGDALEALRHTLRHGQEERYKVDVGKFVITSLLEAQKVKDEPMSEYLRGLQSLTPQKAAVGGDEDDGA
jgi:hypothetical protein